MSKRFKRVIALLLASLMVFALAACGNTPAVTDPPASGQPSATPTASPAPTPAATPEPTPEATPVPTAIPLVNASDDFNGNFSPFFASSVPDESVASMTQVSTMLLDRVGDAVYNQIEGETRTFNGVEYFYQGICDLTSEYDADTDILTSTMRLRDDLKFSDGVPITADDLIFSIYVQADPDFDGLGNLSTQPILGLTDYMTQIPAEVATVYGPIVEGLYAAGKDHVWSESDGWTQEQQTNFWTQIDEKWRSSVQDIIDYCIENYADFVTDLGEAYTAEDLAANEGLQVAHGMANWGFGTAADGIFTTSVTETTFDMANGVFPTFEDYYNETVAAYEGDFVAYLNVETTSNVTGTSFVAGLNKAIIDELAAADNITVDSIPNIEGVVKVDEYTVQILSKGFDPLSAKTLLWWTISPLHYYGDTSLYNYENNQFGFPYGDLSKLREVSSAPMGAGPYKFVEYSNNVVYFEANEYYWEGVPKIQNYQMKYIPSADMISSVATGAADAAAFPYDKTKEAELKTYNSNGELSGDVLEGRGIPYRGRWYIKLYSPSMNIGGDIGSDASKNFRKAFATIYAVNRETAINSYFGDQAFLAEYTIDVSSWAYPQPADEGSRVAFSMGVDGRELYTAEMTQDDKRAAAKLAALEYFEAAGYGVDYEAGKVTTPPEDGVRSTVYNGEQDYFNFEVRIGANGTGDHGGFAILTDSAAMLAEMGITLTINDPATSADNFEYNELGQIDMILMAWGGGEPDPANSTNQYYFSTSRMGATDYNDYGIASAQLDEWATLARQSTDQAYRRTLYKQILDEVLDWGVEVPLYGRNDLTVFSAERINIDTLLPLEATSGFYGSMNYIHLVEMR